MPKGVDFSSHMSLESEGKKDLVDYIDEGPASNIKFENLTISQEFDKTISSHFEFNNPECFKALICPLGLEELRAAVNY